MLALWEPAVAPRRSAKIALSTASSNMTDKISLKNNALGRFRGLLVAETRDWRYQLWSSGSVLACTWRGDAGYWRINTIAREGLSRGNVTRGAA